MSVLIAISCDGCSVRTTLTCSRIHDLRDELQAEGWTQGRKRSVRFDWCPRCSRQRARSLEETGT